MIGRGVKILVDTGSLLEEMGLMKNWKIQGGNAELQTPDAAPYAGIHQEGTNQIPARPFAILQPEDEVAIEKVFDDWMRS
jgi:phage gpG-like protein